MKKIISLLLISILLFSFTACSNNETNKNIEKITDTIETKEENIIIENCISSITNEIDNTIPEEIKYNTTIIPSKDIIFKDAELFLEIINNDQFENTNKYMSALEKFADCKYNKEITESITSVISAIANSNNFSTTMLLSNEPNNFNIKYEKIINESIATIDLSLKDAYNKIYKNFNIYLENNEELKKITDDFLSNENITNLKINIKSENENKNSIIIEINKPHISDPNIKILYNYNN